MAGTTVNAWRPRFKRQAPNSKLQTSTNDQNLKFKTGLGATIAFRSFRHLDFGFVSDFGFRDSDFPAPADVSWPPGVGCCSRGSCWMAISSRSPCERMHSQAPVVGSQFTVRMNAGNPPRHACAQAGVQESCGLPGWDTPSPVPPVGAGPCACPSLGNHGVGSPNAIRSRLGSRLPLLTRLAPPSRILPKWHGKCGKSAARAGTKPAAESCRN